MEQIKEINLNLNQPNHFELIHVMQGSVNSVRVIAHLYDGNQPYQIPDTVEEYHLLGILPSGKYLLDDRLTKYDANSITFLINQNMMAKAGYVTFSISLVESGNAAIAETFPAKIMVTAVGGQDGEQLDEIPLITETLREVKQNANHAAESADAARQSEIHAEHAAADAKTSETNAAASQMEAHDSAAAAKTSEANARTSETNAKTSETNAAASKMAADSAVCHAENAAADAAISAATAATKAEDAENHAVTAESFAHGGTGMRSNENIDNSKYYYEQSKLISESFAGALRPMGTVTSANLPLLPDATEGDMYNISDQFITTTDFKEGAGFVIPAGSNVYKTADGKWDILAGSPVTGIKGSAESDYRKGNVDITPDDIGLGNVGNYQALPTSGGVMTGNIAYQGTKAQTDVIKFLDNTNNVYGNGVAIGGGGLTVIGGGEAADTVAASFADKGSESMAIANDGAIDFYTNCNNGIGNAVHTQIDKTGLFTGTANYANYLNAKEITSSTNLNSITTPGYYYCPANATVKTLTNTPTGNAFFMTVGKHAGIYQEIVEYVTANPKRYMRNCYNNSWGSWYRVYTEANKPTASEVGTIPVANGGTGATSLASGQVLVGNGTGAVTTRGIDTTRGGYYNSSSLTTAGALYSTTQYNRIVAFGTNAISVSSIFSGDYQELMVMLSVQNGNNVSAYTWHVRVIEAPSNGTLALYTGYKTGSYEGFGAVNIVKRTTANIDRCIIGNSDYKSDAKLIIHYR